MQVQIPINHTGSPQWLSEQKRELAVLEAQIRILEIRAQVLSGIIHDMEKAREERTWLYIEGSDETHN